MIGNLGLGWNFGIDINEMPDVQLMSFECLEIIWGDMKIIAFLF